MKTKRTERHTINIFFSNALHYLIFLFRLFTFKYQFVLTKITFQMSNSNRKKTDKYIINFFFWSCQLVYQIKKFSQKNIKSN